MGSYADQIADIAADRRNEIESDLALARQARELASRELEEADRRVTMLESILAMSGHPSVTEPADTTEKVTLHEAMRKVLQTAPGRRMLAAEIATHIDRLGLYKMRDGRPVEAQQIHARVGHYPAMFVRDHSYIRLV